MRDLTDLEKLLLVKDILGRVNTIRLDVGLKLEVARDFVSEAITFLEEENA
jgi:hypothetical protein